ncbi:5'/3'-nucleotidase SurE [Pseudonocardia sp.]|uniref:5'/3'-nucleotidase SurE n=1 Tax=Pseudonocardia sp. TaxID=60912 RepID=UPI0026057D2F|nr:5'/3'-nucleotidase SurE [Pseudonocardia sp.]
MASSRRLRALITNDDGIDSPGLWALAAGARDAGFDVVVAAPHIDASGVGASVFAVRERGRVRLHPRELPDLPGIPAYAVESHPSFIVHSAARGWLDPAPDVVLSGINIGSNVGRAVLHSGTVGAALTAGLHGWRALAVSLDTGWDPPPNPRWDAARHVLPEVLDILLGEDDGTVLNLNVPDRAPAELGELREAHLAQFGSVQIRVDQRAADGVEALHMSLGETPTTPEPGTDTALLLEGHATLTRLETISARAGLLGAVVTAGA